MLIDGLTVTVKGGERELSANIDRFPVSIRVPADVQLVESAEPFLAAGFLEALSRGGTIKIDSEIGISKRLLSNIEILNLIYCDWNKDLSPVTVDCATASRQESIPGLAIMYSAGVDSTYSLLRYEEQITHMVRLFGYQNLDNPKDTAQVIERDSAYATELGKRYIPVRTNFREYMNERKIGMASYWGFPLYAVALALGFSRYIFPANYSYFDLHPTGSHPLTDPLWGNEQIQIDHDICVRRSEKLKHIVKSPHALSRLHVCWRFPAENCGYCSKCVRTATTLRMLGAKTETMPDISVLDALRKERVSTKEGLMYVVDNLLLAQDCGDHEVYNLLKKKIRQYERSLIVAEFDHLFLNGVLRRLHRRMAEPEWRSTISWKPKERLY